MEVIRVEHLTKRYGEVRAVNDISFSVEKGALFAFLGLNGAGKSTTINILSGSLDKDGGKVYIDELDMDKNRNGIKSRLGIVFQNSVLDGVLSVKDNLMLRAGLYGLSGRTAAARVEQLSERLNLTEILKRKVKTLSGGQRRRADIARSLIHDPAILIMDEPTTGLDPQTRNLLWEVIGQLRGEGLTVFLTTHYMEEAADADAVVIIDEGQIAAKGTPLSLKKQYTSDTVRLYGEDAAALQADVAKLGLACEPFAGGVSVTVKNTAEAKLLIQKHPDLFVDFEVIKGDMNSVFLNVTGKALREGVR